MRGANGMLDANDIDLLSVEVQQMTNDPYFDLNRDGFVNETDRSLWVGDPQYRYTYFGDSNLDGEFSSTDFVKVFLAGKYENDDDAGWEDGDWNFDGKFTSRDFVAAFLGGGYELGPRPAVAAVPEPTSLLPLLISVALFGRVSGRRRGTALR